MDKGEICFASVFAPLIIALGEWLFDGQTAEIIVWSIGLAVHGFALHYIGDLKWSSVLVGIGGVVLTFLLVAPHDDVIGIFIAMVVLMVIGWIISSFASHRQKKDYIRREKAMEEVKASLMAEADADEDIQRQVAETKGNWLKKEMKAKHLKRLYVEQRMGGSMQVSYPKYSTLSQVGTDLIWTEISLVVSVAYTLAVVIVGFSFWATYEYIKATLKFLLW